MSSKSSYQCKKCGYTTVKWQGKCPDCGAWNSFAEVVKKADKEVEKHNISGNNLIAPESLEDILKQLQNKKEKRIYKFSTDLLNSFWGGGLVAGGLTLLAGEPGLGKSTFSLQILRALWNGQPKQGGRIKLLYITAEESQFELARRSERLKIPKEIMVLQANNFEQIEQVLETFSPDVVIVDSVQTIFSSDITSAPGSISQVSTLASRLLAISKSKNISIIVVGHVTKEGQIAGPKALEHLVDSVLLLESSENPNYRTLSFGKHRFGTTSSLLLLKMEEKGLEIVTDPSLALLENLEEGVGVVYGLGMDKDLSLLVEVQALVSNSFESGGKGFGKREALGFKQSKLNTILAIVEKYLGFELKSHDIYVQITGLPKNAYDESLDLPILLAILSSLMQKPVETLLKIDKNKKKTAFAGRLTLSGKLRAATNLKERENTAKKLGFNYNQGLKEGSLSDALGYLT